MGNNWITHNTKKMWRYIILFSLYLLIIDYLVVQTLTQYAETSELPNITVDVENVLDGDNSEDDLEDMGALEILAYSSATICITVIVIYIFGISSISSIWW